MPKQLVIIAGNAGVPKGLPAKVKTMHGDFDVDEDGYLFVGFLTEGVPMDSQIVNQILLTKIPLNEGEYYISNVQFTLE